MDLKNSMKISASGMKAQGERLKTIAENLANADSMGKTPGADPYRRKTVNFKSELDRALGANLVKAQQPKQDRSDFELKYDPGHPSANADGYVKMPNVNVLIEMADMREANRSYQANLQVIKQARELISMTIDLMRNQS